jgi:hypothetical protein
MFNNRDWCLLCIAVLITLLFIPTPVSARNCDFAAVIAKDGSLLPEIWDGLQHPSFPITFDCTEDYIYDYLIQRSAYNANGYGLAFYRNGQSLIPPWQTFYTELPYSVDPGPMESAHDAIMDPSNNAVIVLGHDRTGTGGDGNHPFTLDWCSSTYSFMHNGAYLDDNNNPNGPNIKRALWHELYYNWGSYAGEWFVIHESNNPDINPAEWDEFIDSELLFHWIMQNVIDHDGSVLLGLHEALTAVVFDTETGGTINLYSYFRGDVAHNRINFVMSNGEALFVFRNTPFAGNSYAISYCQFGDFVGVKTQGRVGTRVNQFGLVYIPQNGPLAVLDNFLYIIPSGFVWGDVNTNTEWNGIVCVSDDITITNGATLEIGENAVVEFGDQVSMSVLQGNLVLHAGAELRLGNSSHLVSDGFGSKILFEDGSGVSGFRQGDMVIALNGGLITTERNDPQLTSAKTCFKSRSSRMWGGIKITNPRGWTAHADGYYFWNCNFSRCQEFSMTGNNFYPDYARWDIYSSSFTESGRILVKDHHLSKFRNSSYKGNGEPYTVDGEAQLLMYDSTVAKNKKEGILILKSQAYKSVEGCLITGNGASGLLSYSDLDGFSSNDVTCNCCSPLPVGEPAGLKLAAGSKVEGFVGFRNNVFRRNGRAEYEACYRAFNWPNQNNSFTNSHYYVLICTDYLQQPHPVPRRVYGNDFHYNSEQQFLPFIEAFNFDGISCLAEN